MVSALFPDDTILAIHNFPFCEKKKFKNVSIPISELMSRFFLLPEDLHTIIFHYFLLPKELHSILLKFPISKKKKKSYSHTVPKGNNAGTMNTIP